MSANLIRLRYDGSEWDGAINMSQNKNEWELWRKKPDDTTERIRARLVTFTTVLAEPGSQQTVFDFVR